MTCLIAREHRGDNLLSESCHVSCETEIKPLEQCFSHRSRAKVSPWALHATPNELRKISQFERYTTSTQPLGPFRQCVHNVCRAYVFYYIFQFQLILISVLFSLDKTKLDCERATRSFDAGACAFGVVLCRVYYLVCIESSRVRCVTEEIKSNASTPIIIISRERERGGRNRSECLGENEMLH